MSRDHYIEENKFLEMQPLSHDPRWMHPEQYQPEELFKREPFTVVTTTICRDVCINGSYLVSEGKETLNLHPMAIVERERQIAIASQQPQPQIKQYEDVVKLWKDRLITEEGPTLAQYVPEGQSIQDYETPDFLSVVEEIINKRQPDGKEGNRGQKEHCLIC